MSTQRKIDSIDAEILKALLKDARTSFAEIAKLCKVQPNVIRTHFYKLKKDGVITGEIMELRPEFFGYDCKATLRLKVNINKVSSVVEQLKTISEVLQIAEGFGKKNLLCFIITRSIKDLNRIVERIRGLNGVVEAEADLWITTTENVFPANLQINALRRK
ncbi:MAG: winged helix-turn-helix transcriptional regulator [Candidatus Bathyarchaeota archaeon]|nr:winged helix-turn-helix transcriptional regulator [Candidatus Bathyarchaeota archaeon]